MPINPVPKANSVREKASDMRYRMLGRTEMNVSEIGMGGIGAMGKYGPVTPDEFATTMARASMLGMNFLDTAPGYGDSEVVFGHYLKDHRQDWTVCTKIGTCGTPSRRGSSWSNVSRA